MDFARWACRELDILAATHRQLRRYPGELDRAQYSRTTGTAAVGAAQLLPLAQRHRHRRRAPRAFCRGDTEEPAARHPGAGHGEAADGVRQARRGRAQREQSSVDAGTSLCWNSCTHAARVQASVCLRPTWISGSGQVKVFGKGSGACAVARHGRVVHARLCHVGAR
ncbi:MAG: hypothetical protein ACLUVF_10985 [Adlercreutzia sp.]